ncbi:photosystem II reaction center PSB28 protein, chloroplastic-like isoform X2 [Cucurbita moschata]|uniref:Photosystem II reaction center Psb28 protein n=1 Tax=Cucurbita moschata TaxID=3662 RepID=A0A6J1GP93_CUCMO|nr:photosystem II reaction center PSB28 protein, chloroplastic-like isoform X2 [Cucurbita moschata]
MALVVTHLTNLHTTPFSPSFCLLSLSPSLPLSLSLSAGCVSKSMATLQSLASTSLSSPHLHHPSSTNTKACASARLHSSVFSAFHGRSLNVSGGKCQTVTRRRCQPYGRPSNTILMVLPKIQFIQGTDEQTVPDVRLTKSRDGTNGMAIFKFEQPSVFDSSGEVGDITGFYMIDEEGVIQSVDVNAKFINGKPAGIEAKYVMRTPREWDRFMRFMERYSNANGLQFVKK